MPYMPRKLIVGNWKMNGTRAEWAALARDIALGSADIHADLVVCPPHVGLDFVAHTLKETETNVALGSQDMSTLAKGACTGEVSGAMLKELGVKYVIIGHSERRQRQHETNLIVAEKARLALRQGLTPIVCIGESLADKNAGKTIAFLDEQLFDSLYEVYLATGLDLVIAYEPIWAIGTGLTPTAKDVADIARFIRRGLAQPFGDMAPDIRLLYGGSVTPANAAELLTVPDIDGALVGGASLNAESFLDIARAVSAAPKKGVA